MSNLRVNTEVQASVILCCPKCEHSIGVNKVDRSDYYSNMASQLPLKGSQIRDRTPPPVPPSIPLVNKKEESADNEMNDTAGNPAVDIPTTTTLSSKSEEVLVGI